MNRRKILMIIMCIIIILLIIAVGILLYTIYKKDEEAVLASENAYNESLYQLVDYMENVKNYLAKATISTSSTHGAETLTNVWREANLAQTYLSMLPIESQELESTEKFLNQVSEYSYSLSRKNINGENLTDEDLETLEDLHEYSVELDNILNQISTDLNSGNLTWDDLMGDDSVEYATQVSSGVNLADTLEENFHEYSGLIYDGAYSEHLTSTEKKGLTGDEISEEEATDIVKEFIGDDNIEEISNLGLSENASTPVYTYTIKTKTEDSVTITISQIGGHIVYMNSNRSVTVENLTSDEAIDIGKEFLTGKGFENMKETYFLENNGIITVNFAYVQDDVVMYPDLIKLKIALDDGEILGIETTGYLNNHTQRDLSNISITVEEAKETLNKNLEIESEGMAVIPTEWETEILCYEFKGTIDDTEYLVYINCETGEEEDILIITDTPNGTLTM